MNPLKSSGSTASTTTILVCSQGSLRTWGKSNAIGIEGGICDVTKSWQSRCSTAEVTKLPLSIASLSRSYLAMRETSGRDSQGLQVSIVHTTYPSSPAVGVMDITFPQLATNFYLGITYISYFNSISLRSDWKKQGTDSVSTAENPNNKEALSVPGMWNVLQLHWDT